ncbi:GTPase HflX, partial [Chloroflexota bacterium]
MVGIDIFGEEKFLPIDDSLQELGLLADTAGLRIVGQVEQRLKKPNPKTLIGSGKIEEVKGLADELQAEVILFDEELNPRHQRELENIIGEKIKVIDRTALILDIFAQHAQTHEGSL